MIAFLFFVGLPVAVSLIVRQLIVVTGYKTSSRV
jgi:hypothetical protein